MKNRFVILLAEDNENDVWLTKRAFQEHGLETNFQVVRNGFEAVLYLMGEGNFADRTKYPLPSLIISDIKMPRMSGFELLAWKADNEEFKSLPTFILSSSKDEADASLALELGAIGCLVKPTDFESLIRIADQIWNTWSQQACPMEI